MTPLSLYFPNDYPDEAWRGKCYLLEPPAAAGGEWILGRYPSCHIIIQEKSVSRRHASICYSYAADRWTIEDLHSKYGTKLNGRGIVPGDPQPLAVGDKFYLGTPATLIGVVQNEQDTMNLAYDLGGPVVAEENNPRTYEEVLAQAAAWFFSGKTVRGKLYRLAMAIAATTFVVLLIELVNSR
jgi:hypothetical protein